MIIQAGQLVLLSSGEYSDYGVLAIAKSLKDFDTNEETINFLEELKIHSGHDHDIEFRFMAWLHKKGFIEDVPYREVHLGSYGRIEIDEFENYRKKYIDQYLKETK